MQKKEGSGPRGEEAKTATAFSCLPEDDSETGGTDDEKDE